MATLTIKLSDDELDRLGILARSKKISINKLFEEFSTQAIAEFDAETRFRAFAARGSAADGLKILDRLDSQFNS